MYKILKAKRPCRKYFSHGCGSSRVARYCELGQLVTVKWMKKVRIRIICDYDGERENDHNCSTVVGAST